ncbi:ABC transporter substrate-binding protein [Breoghania sp.]|uniref:ABC transporter substrate-binding protein n=1 Tax=Breoghania sp. TaxID=2065378 RepID=UPI00261EEFEA|nr:ABC transporter substrate-binding protein [Breoghania sp.]MDJ0933581.1 ABC transporter substrate-binding protein [Breoghania sp.]
MKSLASAAVGTLLAATAGSAQAAASINIVALYNLSSGGQASLDVPSLNGAKLKAKIINEAGGVLGGRMLKVTALDTKNDTREAAIAAKRAIAMKGVSAGIGFSDSTFVLAAAPLFQTAKIPFVTSGATSPDLPSRLRRWPNTPTTR